MPKLTKREIAQKKHDELLVENFNLKYPEGTPVAYHPFIGDPECTEHTTRGQAYMDNADQPVIFLNGKSGCVSLEHVRVL